MKVTFIEPDGKQIHCEAPLGKTLMEVGRDNNVDIEAACDGTCACSTCHVYIDEEHFAKLPKPTEDELDMLDLAIDVRPKSSRLSCQCQVTSELDGLVATRPKEISNQLS